MSFDRELFADKLKRYCEQLALSAEELSALTGIPNDKISSLLEQSSDPSGDEILILADVFLCDYRFFISNEKTAPFEQTELLYRKHGQELSARDRWSIQEFLYLCECEEFLMLELGFKKKPFSFHKTGKFYKGHGVKAAQELRDHIGHADREFSRDVYHDFRSIGIHIFRRSLENSAISGLYIKHPVAGHCALINYSEDLYRQRFSAAHEAAHAIFDHEQDFILSKWSTKWNVSDLIEIRANTFASCYLVPTDVLSKIQSGTIFSAEVVKKIASQLMVNTDTLIISLKENNRISKEEYTNLRNAEIKIQLKHDPEIPHDLSSRSKRRKESLLKKGLSAFYVEKCFEAHDKGIISTGRTAEMLLMPQHELSGLASIYSVRLRHGH